MVSCAHETHAAQVYTFFIHLELKSVTLHKHEAGQAHKQEEIIAVTPTPTTAGGEYREAELTLAILLACSRTICLIYNRVSFCFNSRVINV